MKKILILILILNVLSCKNKRRNYDSSSTSYSNYEGDYSDGTYCAKIEYYYSKTGTRSTYTLEVEIEDNELTIIYWSNGGWLDDSHFYPPDISDGYAKFENDHGAEYIVEITGEGDCSLSSSAPNKNSFDDEAEICSKCGDSKYSYDDYCDSCTEEENDDDDW